MGGDRDDRERRARIEQSYDELCEELAPTETATLVMPSELEEPRESDSRTVVIDAQAAAMDYAIAASLFPHVQIATPPAGAEASPAKPGLKVVKGRMSEPPPLARTSEPLKIVKGSKIPK